MDVYSAIDRVKSFYRNHPETQEIVREYAEANPNIKHPLADCCGGGCFLFEAAMREKYEKLADSNEREKRKQEFRAKLNQ
jgi:hypothetical protein